MNPKTGIKRPTTRALHQVRLAISALDRAALALGEAAQLLVEKDARTGRPDPSVRRAKKKARKTTR